MKKDIKEFVESDEERNYENSFVDIAELEYNQQDNKQQNDIDDSESIKYLNIKFTPETVIRTETPPLENNYEVTERYVYKKPLLNPFIIEHSQKNDHYCDIEEEEEVIEEYDAVETIVGGKNSAWIVNGIDIRERLTQYQLEQKPPKTKPERYDIIFFGNKESDGFLKMLGEDIVVQMHNDIKREIAYTNDENVKSVLCSIVNREINETKTNLGKHLADSFENHFTSHFVNHMIKLMENDTNLVSEPMSEGSYIVYVLTPILNEIFIKHKKKWRATYGETCLKASSEDCNSQKADDKNRSPGRKIDTIITLREEDEDFSVIEVSGPPLKKNWSHFKSDRMKISKMLKTLINRLVKIRPSSDIRMVRLYGMQSYLYELIIYEFKLNYSEIYTMEEILRFPMPKTWKDMFKAHETVIGLLKYEITMALRKSKENSEQKRQNTIRAGFKELTDIIPTLKN
ncbi:15078_t:CDS:2, partial [Entrophospora sp. SA101]